MKLFRETVQKFFNQAQSEPTGTFSKNTLEYHKNSCHSSGGSGIRKTRYKNCSMRIYRKVFRKDCKKEGEENVPDVKDAIDVNIENIEPVRTSPIRTRMMKPIEPKTDELIYLIDDIDIGNFI